MTIEEAIQHCKDVEKEKRYECTECTEVQDYRSAEDCNECAEVHKQLAEWLIELKQRREVEIGEKPKTNGDRIRHMTDEELAEWLCGEANYSCNICIRQNEKSSCFNYSCEECITKWLKQEVSEDETN